MESTAANTPVSTPLAPIRFSWRGVALCGLAGFLLAVVWSAPFVDRTIGHTVTNALLGEHAEATAISTLSIGAVFALVSGIAGTFTACNIAALSALGPMADGRGGRSRMAVVASRLGWLALGMVGVSAAYGALGVTYADRLPQLSEAVTSAGMPVRLLQSVAVFGVIGVVLVYLGFATIGRVREPLPNLTRRHPETRLVILGAVIGGFLIGRPFSLFRDMFAFAAEQGSVVYGAAVFVLQSLGNVVLIAVVFAVVVFAAKGRLLAALQRHPERMGRFAAATFFVLGSFTFVYWVVRLPARFGYGWFPTMPWNLPS